MLVFYVAHIECQLTSMLIIGAHNWCSSSVPSPSEPNAPSNPVLPQRSILCHGTACPRHGTPRCPVSELLQACWECSSTTFHLVHPRSRLPLTSCTGSDMHKAVLLHPPVACPSSGCHTLTISSSSPPCRCMFPGDLPFPTTPTPYMPPSACLVSPVLVLTGGVRSLSTHEVAACTSTPLCHLSAPRWPALPSCA